MSARLPTSIELMLLAGLAFCLGCVGAKSPPPAVSGLRPGANATASVPSATTPSTLTTTVPAADATRTNTTGDARGQQLNQLMAELQAVGALDPAAQAQLMQDLKQSDPALWPQMVQVFRASLAYRQRAQLAKSNGASSAPAAVAANGAQPVNQATVHQAAVNITTTPVPPVDVTLPLPAEQPPAAIANVAARIATSAPQDKVQTPAATIKTVAYTAEVPSNELAGDWTADLNRTIGALERATTEPPRGAQDTARHAYLRFLYLAAGRKDDALKPIAGLTSAEQDFWVKQTYALSTYLDAERTTDPQRATDAAVQLSQALGRLNEAGNLVVRNLAFCTAVSSYGVHTDFEKSEFKHSQELLLYCEIENFHSAETAKGFHTALKSSYQILDAQGRRVTEHELPLTEEHCQNRRRDYFIRYFVTLPQRIYDGKYTLQLTIEDTLGHKVGQSSIDFTVHDKR